MTNESVRIKDSSLSTQSLNVPCDYAKDVCSDCKKGMDEHAIQVCYDFCFLDAPPSSEYLLM